MQVTELKAAVHKLNQDKCTLESQMEMEEVQSSVLMPIDVSSAPICRTTCQCSGATPTSVMHAAGQHESFLFFGGKSEAFCLLAVWLSKVDMWLW